MSLHVSVVIVGYRNAADVARCVASLERSTHGDFEIVVCENGGRSAFQALQAAIPERLAGGQPVRLIEAPGNLGYAAGINIGVAASKDAGAWWILNPDTEVRPDAMAALIAHYRRGYDAVGCTICFPSGEIQWFGGVWMAWQAKAIALGYGSPKGTKPDPEIIELGQNFISGASMFVSREFIQTVGPMPEHFFLYCEEVEWFLSGVSHGMRLGFAPDAVVIHHQGTTTGYSKSLKARSGRSVFLDERNKMILTRDRYPARLPIVAGWVFIRIFGRYGREGAYRQIAYGIWGWFMGLCGQRGAPRWAREGPGP